MIKRSALPLIADPLRARAGAKMIHRHLATYDFPVSRDLYTLREAF
jgi:hypothetical protein